ncbi:unnamed protein product, partial [Musa acuminata subsp. burmannicoides]
PRSTKVQEETSAEILGDNGWSTYTPSLFGSISSRRSATFSPTSMLCSASAKQSTLHCTIWLHGHLLDEVSGFPEQPSSAKEIDHAPIVLLASWSMLT